MRRLATSGERAVWRALTAGLGAELHLSRVVRLTGAVDAEELARVTAARLSAAAPLHARFSERDAQLWVELPADVSDATEVAVDAVPDGSAIRHFVEAPFALGDEPGLRARVFVGVGYVELAAVAHHLVSDGLTLDAFVLDVLEAFAGGNPAPPRAITAPTEAGAINPEDWHRRIDAEQERPWTGDATEVREVFVLNAWLAESRGLREVAKAGGLTLAQALMSVFAATLHSWADRDAIAFVTPVDVRSRADRGAWGMGVNSIAVQSLLSHGQSFSEFARSLRSAFATSLRDRFRSLPEIARASGLRRRHDGSSILTDFEFNFTKLWDPPAALRQLGVTVSAVEQLVTRAQYDVSLSAVDRGDHGVSLIWQLRGSADAQATAQALNDIFNRLAEAWVVDPGAIVSTTEILSPAAIDELLRAGTGAVIPVDMRSLPERVLQHAVFAGERLAVRTGEADATYSDLAARVATARHRLRACGVRPGDRVAVHLDRGLDLVVTMLALWSEGAVYVPIDRVNPPVRVAEMLDLTHPAVLVSRGERPEEVLNAMKASGTVLLDVSEASSGTVNDIVHRPADERWPSYVMFTSGSTGKPKAVEVHVAGFLNHLDEMIRSVDMTDRDVFGQLAPLGFDVHIWQLMAPLAVGCVLRIFSGAELRDPMGLAALSRKDRVTVLQAVPSYLEQWCDLATGQGEFARVPSLRALFVTGEAFPAQLASRLAELFPSAVLVNAYGPAECSDDVTLFVAAPHELASGVVPIGPAVANTRLYVLDRWQRLRPPGLRGELAIGGIAVGNGYLEEDSKAAFRADPWNAGGRLYLTGDVCTMSGSVVRFHGRVDHQVKVGGRRVELEEIENACLTLPNVSSAAVSLVRTPSAEVLVAFVTSDIQAEQEWRAALSARLPAFMVPGMIVPIDAVPLSANGKVDRRQLAERAKAEFSRRQLRSSGKHPAQLAWERVLGTASISASDNFFALGGDSLGALRVISELREMGVRAEIAHLYEATDLESFAALVESADPGEPPASGVVELPPFVQWHLSGGFRHFVSAVRFELDANREDLARALESVAWRHPLLQGRIEMVAGVWRLVLGHGRTPEVYESPSTSTLEGDALDQLSADQLFSCSAHWTEVGIEICLAASHAVVDQQSWLLILSDLEDALRGTLTGTQDYGFTSYCEALRDDVRLAVELGALHQPSVVEEVQLERDGSSSPGQCAANALASVLSAIAATASVTSLNVAVEHDLRFSGASARGVGCFVDVTVDCIAVGEDLRQLTIAADGALRRRPGEEPKTRLGIDVLFNVVPALGEDRFANVRRLQLSEVAAGRGLTPARYVVDVQILADKLLLRMSMPTDEGIAWAEVVKQRWDTLSSDQQSAVEGVDLLDLDQTEFQALLNEVEGLT